MARQTDPPRVRVRPLEAAPHGIVTIAQLREHGFTRDAIAHERACGGLHPLHRGVYAVGRPVVTRHGEWLAAVVACGEEAWLGGADAAALVGIRPDRRPPVVEVTVRGRNRHRRPGILVHRTTTLTDRDVTIVDSIPVTGVVRTLIDIAPRLTPRQLERAVNEADRLGLIDPDALRRELERAPRTHGASLLRRLLDRRTFSRTRSGVERDFIRIALRAGLPKPLTLQVVSGYEVDFYWPHLGLVVETDSWLHHRTPFQIARDRERDQAHAAAGLTCLRFTAAQIHHEPRRVERTLKAVARRLSARLGHLSALQSA